MVFCKRLSEIFYVINLRLLMDRKELYEEIMKLIPSNYEVEDGFLAHLDGLFSRYKTLIAQFDETSFEYKRKPDKIEKISKDELMKQIDKIISYIRQAAHYVYKGCNPAAFEVIRKVIQVVLTSLPLKVFPEKSHFYRMRTMENRDNVGINDLFHIPLKKRGIVKTQRYSAPGYPCLYLGESVYVCWEEMLRPDLNHCFVSRLENQREIPLLDLSYPELSEWIKCDDNNSYTYESNYKIISSLTRLPLLIACMVKVRNTGDVFKPEYIIPQIIMSMIIYHIRFKKKNEQKPLYVGVYYTTVHQNRDFNFISPDDNGFYNYSLINNIAIPVQSPLSPNKFCPELCEWFEITEPTCDEFERAKMPYHYSERFGLNFSNVDKYQLSTFGQLEERLNHLQLKTIKPQ